MLISAKAPIAQFKLFSIIDVVTEIDIDMKNQALRIFGLFLIPVAFACNSAGDKTTDADSSNSENVSASTTSYVNLNTGEPVSVERDSEKGYYVYSDTKEPIENDLFFVDVNSRDTLYGKTGVVINNALVRANDAYQLNEALVERDGDEIKIKTANGKIKIDGDEVKYKEGDTKVKIDGDESKIKTSDTKIKTDGAETKVKDR